jgi:hypothetical protein
MRREMELSGGNTTASLLDRNVAMLRGILISAALLLPLQAGAQSLAWPSTQFRLDDTTGKRSLLRDSWMVYNAPAGEYRLENYFLSTRHALPANSYLTARPDLIYGLERVELSRTETAMRGFAMGASAGLFAGAVAGTMGLWDEDTSWALIGALGALGAIFGGTRGYEDPSWRIRYRFTDD